MELTAACDRLLSSGWSMWLREPFGTALVLEGFLDSRRFQTFRRSLELTRDQEIVVQFARRSLQIAMPRDVGAFAKNAGNP